MCLGGAALPRLCVWPGEEGHGEGAEDEGGEEAAAEGGGGGGGEEEQRHRIDRQQGLQARMSWCHDVH